MGEFGPILLITPLLDQGHAQRQPDPHRVRRGGGSDGACGGARGDVGLNLLERTLETSGQLAIRIAVVLVFALAALASDLGLDLLLGGFVAGVIVREALKGREIAMFESKLTAVGYGFFIPFFFVVRASSSTSTR